MPSVPVLLDMVLVVVVRVPPPTIPVPEIVMLGWGCLMFTAMSLVALKPTVAMSPTALNPRPAMLEKPVTVAV